MRHEGLDALRGIAALCVVFQHAAARTTANTDLYWPLLETFNFGRFGVILFFLISGFVIPPSLERGGLRLFAVNRAFRLLPILWLSVGTGILIHIYEGRAFTAADVAASMVMLADPLGLHPMLGVYWTLTIELYFYIACCALFAAGLLGNVRITGAIALMFAIVGAMLGREMWAFPAWLFTGMVIRRAYDGDPVAKPWAIACVAAVLCAAVILALGPNSNKYLQPLPRGLAMVLPTPIFLLFVFRPIKVSAPLVTLGTISYSIYLLHVGALRLLPAGPLYPFLICGLTIIFAALAYRFIERPMIQFGRRLSAPRYEVGHGGSGGT